MIGFQNATEAKLEGNPVPGLVEQIFRRGGWLQKYLGMEHRPQQEAMARQVVGALQTDQPLLFEAGTGVGKSLAYLIPSILVAVHQKRQGIIATHTISLQEQIEKKDLQICRDLFGKVAQLAAFEPFKVALLVGKGNYLCATRLNQAIAQKTELIPSEEQSELERIVRWSQRTKVGIRQELVPAPVPDVWDWVSAESSVCHPKRCKPKDCPYQRARARIRQSHLLIVNHSLLFALLGSGMPLPTGRGVLYAEDFVILDEGHTVPAVATKHFGMAISSYGLNRLLLSFYNPKKQKGLLKRKGEAKDRALVVRLREEADDFFGYVRMTFLEQRDVARIYRPNWADTDLLGQLSRLITRVKEIARSLKDGPQKAMVDDQCDRLTHYRNGIHQFIAQSLEDQVYWVERRGRGGRIIHLRSAPIDVAEYLKECVFMRETGVILTSATLATGPNLENFQKKVGAEKEAAFQVDSPFDYENRVEVGIAEDCPPPNHPDGKQYLDYLEDTILFCVEQAPGGTLALFTNYRDLNQMARRLEPRLQRRGRSILQQGRDYSRTELTREFAKAGNAVLLGTDSFWAGVDVPGPALSQVIITRLPFENPSHPIQEAKSDWLKSQGKSPFWELSLPDAIIKFRQGVGRLIRKKTDSGLITILDSRILTKQYGLHFLNSLPKKTYHRFNRNNRDMVFDRLLG